MALLKKIKINLDYLLGNTDSSLYTEARESPKLTLEDWQKRWEIFSGEGNGFTWYGVDSEENLAEFCGEEAYVPEVFFQSISSNKKLAAFFDNLPEITSSVIPQNLRPELKKAAIKSQYSNNFWANGANKGLFVFSESAVVESNKNSGKPFYELKLIPQEPLKLINLPNDVQKSIKPYQFENLIFTDCQFLDVSKYFYCEK